MSSRTSKATTTASRYSPSRRSTRGSFIPATTCAFVTTRFGAAAQPEPETPRPQALPVTRKTLLRAERTAGLASSAGSGGATFASGPRIVEKRIDPRDRVEQARRRHALVDLTEDPRALHLLSQLALAGQVERHGPHHPDDRDAGDGAEHETAERVEPPQWRQHEQARPNRAPGHRRDALEEDHEHGCPAERDQRCVRATRGPRGTRARAWRRCTRRRRFRPAPAARR